MFQGQVIVTKASPMVVRYEKFEIEAEEILKDKRTTLMLKNIPMQYTVKDLILEIDAEFRGKYDFFYMP